MTYKVWPLEFDYKWQRPELDDLAKLGYSWQDPYEIVDIFERKVADYAGSKFAVAVDSCSHGLFLSLKYLNATDTITIPNRTYVSVPMQIIHAGCKVNFSNVEWSGIYQLSPYPVYDGAVRWTQNMYCGGFHVLSFQIKKRIPIGRGGMILTDDKDAYEWFKRACYDGRNIQVPHNLDTVQTLGWHYYMTPEDAARGIILMDHTKLINPDSATHESYAPLDHLKVFK
jgi:dTDP-4-amino-4,6-dideoxygalactose transaminase